MIEFRTANAEDAAGINEVGNYYIENTPANFKTEPLNLLERKNWIQTFSNSGRYRLVVATDKEVIRLCLFLELLRPVDIPDLSSNYYISPTGCQPQGSWHPTLYLSF